MAPTRRKLVYMPLSEIRRAARNPKGHDAPQIQASVKRFGFVEVITLDERTKKLVSGHGRLDELERGQEAGEDLPDGIIKLKGEWAAPVVRGWASKNDAEAEAFIIAANRITEVGGWDKGGLAQMLQDLELSPDAGLDGTGYDSNDLAQLLDDLAPPIPPLPPGDFPSFDDDIVTEYQCPSCGYAWSGAPKQGTPSHVPPDDDE